MTMLPPFPLWEYTETFSVSIALEVKTTLPQAPGTYGTEIFVDNKLPVFECTLKSIRGHTYQDVLMEMKKCTHPKTLYQYFMIDGDVIQGRPTKVSATRIRGSYFYEVEVTVRRFDIKSILPID